jgi:diguanylate cyclase (GGDEF)-like protein/PAS domain S-box-containing protein
MVATGLRVLTARLLTVALAYFVTGWLGLQIPYAGSQITLVWLPTGIAVAALLRWGWAMAAGIYVGAFCVNLVIGPSWLLAGSIAVGNTLGPLANALLLKRAGFHQAFDRQKDVRLFVGASAIGMLLPASIGVLSLHQVGLIPLSAMAGAWLAWWMGDSLGVMLAAPLLLTLNRRTYEPLRHAIGALLLWLLFASVVVWLAFFQNFGQAGRTLPLAFLSLPLLTWASLRFGTMGGALAVLFFSVAAALSTALGYGFVLRASGQAGLFLLWLYITTIALTELMISSIQARRVQAESSLRVAAAAFEAQVGIMVTDTDLHILRINRAFSHDSGYTAEEVVGRRPNMFQSGRHDQTFYNAMWDSIKRTGAWQGEIWDRRKNGEIYPKWMTITAVTGSDGRPTHYVSTQIDTTESKAAENEIRTLAFYDPLTSLPNRRLLLNRLQQAMTASARSSQVGALLFIDLDHFKSLNDTLGHDQGDLLLQQVGQRLSACLRESDTVARLGGDEFVIILEGLGEAMPEAAAQARVLGEKILAAFAQPFVLGEYEQFSTPSIGVALFHGHHDQIGDLLKRADLAMYQAKAAGRNAIRFFDPEMQAVVNARVALEADLRHALQHREFVVKYQPQVDADGQMTGAEALVRWQHPQRGSVPPADFIPLAEDTGQILQLGQWVLETACQQLALWGQSAHTRTLDLAVNISARQFYHPDFVEQVLATLERTGANPRLLKLELTESLLLTNIDDTIVKMSRLKTTGIRFSLDDFGTGYSSLAYLKRLPLDQLKIDQSFVRDILTDSNDAAIARTIVALGNSLGLSVIAEGVETVEQLSFLARHGCMAYQGYYFSQPLTAGEMEGYLRGCLAGKEEAVR